MTDTRVLLVSNDMALNASLSGAFAEQPLYSGIHARVEVAKGVVAGRIKLRSREHELAVVRCEPLTTRNQVCGLDLIQDVRTQELDNNHGGDALQRIALIALMVGGVSDTKVLTRECVRLGADEVVHVGEHPDLVRAVFDRTRELLIPRMPVGSKRSGSTPPLLTSLSKGLYPLRIDHVRKKVLFCAVELDLTKTEYRLLTVLLRQLGRAYTRKQLLHEVDDRTCVLERTVDVHIRAIRQKIAKAASELGLVLPASGMIETVRGVGYRGNESVTIEDLLPCA